MFNRALVRWNICFLVMLSLALAQVAGAKERGVIDGAAGSGELRAEKSATAAVVDTVKPGEPFSFEQDKDNEWGKVTLGSGKSGWLPLSKIRLFYDESDLPKKDPSGLSEIDEMARRRGLDYVKVTRLAAKGDAKALKQFFALAREADGAAAESITTIPTVVYHLLGDGKFAKFLSAQPIADQTLVRDVVLGDGRLPPTTPYVQRHFPETAKVLFPSEVVAWPSPDGRYAIRKVFSDPFDMGGGKIARAELIEKKTGKVLLDMTADDIGTGADREGKIVWAPDSKRFASLSTRMNLEQGNLWTKPHQTPHRKQTVVYQVTGDLWGRVELPLDKVPGRENDTELKAAILGHDYIEPIRWLKRNVLLLERHEYYERKKQIENSEFQSIHPFARWHSITATISPEGKATVVWKLKKDR